MKKENLRVAIPPKKAGISTQDFDLFKVGVHPALPIEIRHRCNPA